MCVMSEEGTSDSTGSSNKNSGCICSLKKEDLRKGLSEVNIAYRDSDYVNKLRKKKAKYVREMSNNEAEDK